MKMPLVCKDANEVYPTVQSESSNTMKDFLVESQVIEDGPFFSNCSNIEIDLEQNEEVSSVRETPSKLLIGRSSQP